MLVFIWRFYNISKLFLFLLFFSSLIFSCTESPDNDVKNKKEPSLVHFRKSLDTLKRENDFLINRKIYSRLVKNLDNISNDSLRNIGYFELAYVMLEKEDSLNFLMLNRKNMILSEKLNDSSRLAESNWDKASFYSKLNIKDSSFYYYYQAFRIYDLIEDDLQAGRMLLSIAIIQKNIKDYTGSEITTIKAISYIKPYQNNKYLYSAYNNLGIIFNELEDYQKSLEFHKQAQIYLSKDEELKVFKETSLNNIGVVFQNMKNQKEAEAYFEKALQNNDLNLSNPELYAMLLDNLAYSKFLGGGFENVENLFLRSHNIRDSLNHKSGLTVNKLHLAEYYAASKDTSKAIAYVDEAYQIAKITRNFEDLLKALLLVASMDPGRSTQAYNSYIHINDSLQQEERAIRDKFARIQFETNEFIKENHQLNEQKQWMIFGFSGLSLSLLLGLVILSQRSKNRKLRLIQQQQESNEEIYNLLIQSQEKVEEGQEKEKKRISREIHDGILSQFFGVRLNLEFLNQRTDVDSVEKRSVYIQELKKLENEIRKVSHELNDISLNSDIIFIKIVEDLLQQQENLGGYKGLLTWEEGINWDKLSPRLKMNLYRIIQEALHNINKHAQAQEVIIHFEKEENFLVVKIVDDGIGFNTESTSIGIGITNIKSRVKDIKGQISFQSGKEGTIIKLKLPM